MTNLVVLVGRIARDRHIMGRHASGRLSRIMAAAFSAIIMIGPEVLPLMSVGMMEASATRNPRTPRTQRRESTTASSSLPMRQVPLTCQ